MVCAESSFFEYEIGAYMMHIALAVTVEGVLLHAVIIMLKTTLSSCSFCDRIKVALLLVILFLLPPC